MSVQRRLLADYAEPGGEESVERLRAVARPLAGATKAIHNALQRVSDAIVQESVREGFGLLDDAHTRESMGVAGRERVRERFLSLRQVKDRLRLMSGLA